MHTVLFETLIHARYSCVSVVLIHKKKLDFYYQRKHNEIFILL